MVKEDKIEETSREGQEKESQERNDDYEIHQNMDSQNSIQFGEFSHQNLKPESSFRGLICPRCHLMCLGLETFKDHMAKFHGELVDHQQKKEFSQGYRVCL